LRLIQGRNMTTFVAYEDKFCKNSQQLGVAVLGDSISAHFHIPEEWLGNQIDNFGNKMYHSILLHNNIFFMTTKMRPKLAGPRLRTWLSFWRTSWTGLSWLQLLVNKS
jgi:hypothetical protein